jgi:hypothetical protein
MQNLDLKIIIALKNLLNHWSFSFK